MPTIETQYLGDLRTEAKHLQSDSKLITDAPLDNQGKGETFSPTDLLATSLGSCMLTIMGISARAHGYSIDGTRIEITKIMASNPRRVAEIELHFYLPEQQYSEHEKMLIDKAARTCPVALSLHPDLKQNIIFHYQS